MKQVGQSDNEGYERMQRVEKRRQIEESVLVAADEDFVVPSNEQLQT